MGNIRKRGNSWTAQVRIAGWRSFTKTFKKKTDAIAWSVHLENKLRNAPVPTIIADSKVTLSDLVIRYAEEIAPSHKSSVPETYRLRAIARSWIGELDIRYLNKQQFSQYQKDRLEKVSVASVHAELSLIKRVLDTAIKQWGYGIVENVIKTMKYSKGNVSRTRRLETDEKESILTVARLQRNDYICSVIEFAIETGMRRSEILKLKWCDINFHTGFASLFDTKNGEDRKVPLTLKCVQLLNQLPRSHEHVFPLSATCLNQAWQRAVKKAGIKDLRFHDLRHEAVSRFFEMGMNIAEVALISGHKDVTQLFRYTHLNPEMCFRSMKHFTAVNTLK
jgi:integrase